MPGLDFRPQWESGLATIGEIESQLPSIRVVMAGYDAAVNAGLALSYYTLIGDGYQAGLWEAGIFGSEIAITPWEHKLTQADHDKIHDFIRHWQRLVSNGDWNLQVKDSITGEIVAQTNNKRKATLVWRQNTTSE